MRIQLMLLTKLLLIELQKNKSELKRERKKKATKKYRLREEHY